jgi:hypothetical protein
MKPRLLGNVSLLTLALTLVWLMPFIMERAMLLDIKARAERIGILSSQVA